MSFESYSFSSLPSFNFDIAINTAIESNENAIRIQSCFDIKQLVTATMNEDASPNRRFLFFCFFVIGLFSFSTGAYRQIIISATDNSRKCITPVYVPEQYAIFVKPNTALVTKAKVKLHPNYVFA